MKSKYKITKNSFGFYQIKPTPTDDEITKFYAEEFYSGEYKNFNDSSLKVQTNDDEFYRGRWNDIYQNILEIKKNLPNKTSILDIGCGWGLALEFFKKKGMLCYGFDPSIEAVEYANKNKLNVKHAGIKNMDVFEGKKFNIITMLNVLEHLSDPILALKQIKKIFNIKFFFT